jgi:RecJ-like exonuclease
MNFGDRQEEAKMASETNNGNGNGSSPKPNASDMNPGDDAPPGTPGTGEDVCLECNGTGNVQDGECPNCGGTGKVIKGVAGG